MKKRLIALVIGTFIGVSIVSVLFWSAQATTQNDTGFTRQVRKHLLTIVSSVDLQRAGWYVSGNSGGQIHLSNFYTPNIAFGTDDNLKDTAWLQLSVANDAKIDLSAVNISFTKDSFYVLNGVDSNVHVGGRLSKVTTSTRKIPVQFDYALPMDSTKYIIRTYDKTTNQNLLALYSEVGNQLKQFFLEKEREGVFSTSGATVITPDQTKIFYVYTYKNRLTCLNNLLGVVYNKHTIDTNSLAKLHVDTIKSEKRITFSQPPLKVNKAVAASDRYLFVCSALRATNEEGRVFDAASVVDVYSNIDGAYEYSFYVPDFHGKKITGMAVSRNNLLTIHDRYLVVYEFLNGLP